MSASHEPMLREIAGVRQDRPDLRRRWFEDDYFDLFVWTDATGAVTAFQLAYDKGEQERLLAWDRDAGYLHRRIDAGEESGFKNMTPLLTTSAGFAKSRVLAQFDARASDLDDALRHFVREKAKQYRTRAR